MKQLTMIALACMPLCMMAQKIKIDSGNIYVDGKVYAEMEKDGCGTFSQTCIYTFKNLKGKPVLIVKIGREKVPTEINSSNPDGTVIYADFNFLASKQKGQVANVRIKAEKIIERLIKAKLFKDGELDEEAASNFVLVNPVVYGTAKETIIIKQEAAPEPKNSLKINF